MGAMMMDFTAVTSCGRQPIRGDAMRGCTSTVDRRLSQCSVTMPMGSRQRLLFKAPADLDSCWPLLLCPAIS